VNHLDLKVTHPIVFFDGECVMCNGFLNWMMAIDRTMIFRVSPLQGETAAKVLPPLAHNPEEWSIYYLDETGLYSQSEAVIQILRKLGGMWRLLAVAGVVPVGVRDAVYRIVASNRYRVLGKYETCRVPNEAERSRFLA
jgi:predicted DCC family thiol-disulfide oxidoreductase YuxK